MKSERTFESLETRGRPPATRQPLLIGLVLIGVGSAQIHAFGGFAISRFVELPGNTAADYATVGLAVEDDGVKRLLESRRQAIDWEDRAQPHRDLALGYMSNTITVEEKQLDRPTVLRMAVEEAAAATTISPVHPNTLAIAALANLTLEERPDARQSLQLSYALVPYWPEAAMIRSSIAMRMWSDLAADQRLSAARDFKTMVKDNALVFAELAIKNGFLENARNVLSDDEDAAYDLKIAVRTIEDQEVQKQMDQEEQARTERFRLQQKQ